MRAVIQNVKEASLSSQGNVVSKIGPGVYVLVGIMKDDTEKDVEKFVDKLLTLRIWPDAEGKLNLGLQEAGVDMLVVSQFTLGADLGYGRRPSYHKIAPGAHAEKLYAYTIQLLDEASVNVKTGTFGKHMEIETVLDGPVTIMFDSEA